MAEQLRVDGVEVITVCPGLTDTALISAMFGRVGATVDHAADDSLAAALTALPSCTYLQDGEIQIPGRAAADPAVKPPSYDSRPGRSTCLAWTMATTSGRRSRDSGGGVRRKCDPSGDASGSSWLPRRG